MRPVLDCGGGGPKSNASRVPAQASGGAGAAKRSLPTGGRANGMPRKTAIPSSRRPRTAPAAVRAWGSVSGTGYRAGSRMTTVVSGWARRLWNQAGLAGAPALDAKIA